MSEFVYQVKWLKILGIMLLGFLSPGLLAEDLSSSRSAATPTAPASSTLLSQVPQKNSKSSLKVTTSQDLDANVKYEEQISESLFIRQENSWNNPTSFTSSSGMEDRTLRRYKNSNVWSADLLVIDKVYLGASTSLDRQFEQGDASRQYQLGKNAYVKWKPTKSTEIQSGQYTYVMFGEDWGDSTTDQYYFQVRQKIASTPISFQLKPCVNNERIDNTDNTFTYKNGQQIDGSVDFQVTSRATWTMGSQWKNARYQDSYEVETTKNLYSRWNLNPTSRYNLNVSTTFEKFRKEDEDTASVSSAYNKFTLQFGQKFRLDDDLTASFDMWQSTINHATSDVDSTREHAATLSIQKKF